MFFDKWFSNQKLAREVNFSSNGILTLGVEVELQLIDNNSFNLTPKFNELAKLSTDDKLKQELYLSTAEINTNKCLNVAEIEQDLSASFDDLNKIGKQIGVEFSTTGCHPFSRYDDCIITPSSRYNELLDRNKWLTRRMTIYALHVHLGMKDGEEYVRFNNFFLHFLPHLLALSASSPFWQGSDTGLASCRATTYESIPTAGSPYPVKSWHDFEHLYKTLKKCQAINSLKDLWWDIRPSPIYGTLEIRVCDGLATLSETLAITAYIHLLANWFNDNGSWIDKVSTPVNWVARENKWRVIRHGLEADLIMNHEGVTKPVRQDILEWLEKFSGYEKKFGYEKYMNTIRDILKKGNSSTRQMRVYNQTNSIEEVVKFNIAEFNKREPFWN
jgi:carboxylate-amine ligase